MAQSPGQGLDPVAALALSQEPGPSVLPTGGNQNVLPTASAAAPASTDYTPLILLAIAAFFVFKGFAAAA